MRAFGTPVDMLLADEIEKLSLFFSLRRLWWRVFLLVGGLVALVCQFAISSFAAPNSHRTKKLSIKSLISANPTISRLLMQTYGHLQCRDINVAATYGVWKPPTMNKLLVELLFPV